MNHFFNVILNDKETSPSIVKSLQDSLNKIQHRIDNPKNLEHHHINIFYDFNQKELKEKTTNIIVQIQELHNYIDKETDLSDEEFKKLYLTMNNLKTNIKEVSETYRGFLDKIRNELQKHIE